MSWLTDLFASRTAPAATPADKTPRAAPSDKPQPVLHDTPDLALLKHFVPMRDLDDDIIKAIPYCLRQYQAGETICQLGETADSVIYLVRGEIEVQPDGKGLHYLLPDQSARAHLPISSGQRFGATVIAKTAPVIILAVAPEITKLWIARGNQNVSYIELSNIELPPQISNNLFFNSFARAYHENRLNLPTLPDVALRLKEALNHDIGTTEAAQIIQMDAAIVTKLIQVANSPLYSPVTPIANCHDAVTRLGLSATKNLVLSISLRQLYSRRATLNL